MITELIAAISAGQEAYKFTEGLYNGENYKSVDKAFKMFDAIDFNGDFESEVNEVLECLNPVSESDRLFVKVGAWALRARCYAVLGQFTKARQNISFVLNAQEDFFTVNKNVIYGFQEDARVLLKDIKKFEKDLKKKQNAEHLPQIESLVHTLQGLYSACTFDWLISIEDTVAEEKDGFLNFGCDFYGDLVNSFFGTSIPLSFYKKKWTFKKLAEQVYDKAEIPDTYEWHIRRTFIENLPGVNLPFLAFPTVLRGIQFDFDEIEDELVLLVVNLMPRRLIITDKRIFFEEDFGFEYSSNPEGYNWQDIVSVSAYGDRMLKIKVKNGDTEKLYFPNHTAEAIKQIAGICNMVNDTHEEENDYQEPLERPLAYAIYDDYETLPSDIDDHSKDQKEKLFKELKSLLGLPSSATVAKYGEQEVECNVDIYDSLLQRYGVSFGWRVLPQEHKIDELINIILTLKPKIDELEKRRVFNSVFSCNVIRVINIGEKDKIITTVKVKSGQLTHGEEIVILDGMEIMDSGVVEGISIIGIDYPICSDGDISNLLISGFKESFDWNNKTLVKKSDLDEYLVQQKEYKEDNESVSSDKSQITTKDTDESVAFDESSSEEEYLTELKACLDDGVIGASERRLLNKLRDKLGISEERAKELEESFKATQLTDDEKEYLDEFKAASENGIVSEKERRLLEKLRKMLAISEERAREIEKY